MSEYTFNVGLMNTLRESTLPISAKESKAG